MRAATVAVQTAQEGAMPERNGSNDPAQMFQQIMQQMTQGGSGSPPDAFDFTTKPTAEEVNHSELVVVKLLDATSPTFDGYSNTDGSIDVLAIDPLDPHGSAGITFSYYSYEW
jgi:hypothetical protein